ncbi:MAG TPA: magnesium-translocating P-type ATPase, partial [Chloroflexota bacterium]
MAIAGPASSPPPFWVDDVDTLCRSMDSTPAGLTAAEAKQRLQEFGPNDLARQRKSAALEIILFFTNPLVLILLLAALVSGVMGEYVNAGLIAVIVSLSVLLNFFQAYRSQQAADRLRQLVVTTATVLRDGGWLEIPQADIVPGDVIRLSAGDLIPADARLIESQTLYVNEAALTGESMPARKEAQSSIASTALVDARDAVFLGTSVVSGTATAVVAHTGRQTEIGHIAQHLAARPPQTEFERGTHAFGMMIMRTVILLVLFVFVVNALVKHTSYLESFLFAIALAVGLTPEFLPMIMSVTLSAGALRMARKKVVVKRLATIENFGSMDILCSDKTGTLTEGKIALEQYVDIHGDTDQNVLLYAVLNAAFETGIKSPLDDALVHHSHPDIARYTKAGEIPFDFLRRRSSIAVQDGSGYLLVTKGAPEGVLPLCQDFERGGKKALFQDEDRQIADQTFRRLSGEGQRVLAVAYRRVTHNARYTPEDEHNLTLVGFAAFLDPPKESAAKALADLREAGIAVKIMTGDNELVTQAICCQVGLDGTGIVLGEHLDRTSDEALGVLAERTSVFARVSPEQKNRLMRTLRERGHVVGFMGDGINDAPSLHNADVGISVSDAVDVAKEAAEIILLEESLEVLHDGVLEGRRSFGNVMKYIMMGTSSNFGNMFSMAGASLFLPFLPMLPLQILLNNFIYDVSQLTIPSDRVDNGYVAKPKRWNINFIQHFMLIVGPISSIYDFLTFGVLIWLFHSSEALFHTGWFVESLATQTLVILVIRTSLPPWKSRPSRTLVAGIFIAVAVAMVLPFTAVSSALGFVALPVPFFIFLVV